MPLLLKLTLSCFGYLLLICLKQLLENLIVTVLVQGNIVFGHADLLQLCLAAWDSGLYVIVDIRFSASLGKIDPTLTAISPCDLCSEARKYRPQKASTIPVKFDVPGLC